MRISDWSSDVCSSDLSELLPYSLVQFRDIFLPEIIEADQIIHLRHVPEGPAVAAGRALGGSADLVDRALLAEIGRASCRERVCQYVLISVVAVSLKKKHTILH